MLVLKNFWPQATLYYVTSCGLHATTKHVLFIGLLANIKLNPEINRVNSSESAESSGKRKLDVQ